MHGSNGLGLLVAPVLLLASVGVIQAHSSPRQVGWQVRSHETTYHLKKRFAREVTEGNWKKIFPGSSCTFSGSVRLEPPGTYITVLNTSPFEKVLGSIGFVWPQTPAPFSSGCLSPEVS